MGRLLLFLICLGVIIGGVLYLTQDDMEKESTQNNVNDKVEEVAPKVETDVAETEQPVLEDENECLLVLTQFEAEIKEVERDVNSGKKFDATTETKKYTNRIKLVQQKMIDKGCNTNLDYSLKFSELVKRYASLFGKMQYQ